MQLIECHVFVSRLVRARHKRVMLLDLENPGRQALLEANRDTANLRICPGTLTCI
jgi:hypothetical protein